MNEKIVVITDRGGHLHDALSLLKQMNLSSYDIITTNGPDVEVLKSSQTEARRVFCFPQAFSWWGKRRFWNPVLQLKQWFLSLVYAFQIRPTFVISTGASNVVPFCYFAKALGAKICHIENLAQVDNASITGRLLYPIADHFFVQWEELLSQYGKKAAYCGWVV